MGYVEGGMRAILRIVGEVEVDIPVPLELEG